VGGLDLGLEVAGFKHLGCIEIEESARRSLKANRSGKWALLDPGDISLIADQLRPSDLGLRRRQLTLLAGAPPCQPFSKAAQWSRSARSGMDDVRSHCLKGFLRLAETFLPQAILIENVTGFAQGEVAALPAIARALTKINITCGTHYHPQARILDTADFGVPQHRRRAIILALRDGAAFRWPSPSHADHPLRAWDAIGGMSIPDPPTAIGKWADLLPSIPEGQNYLWHTPRGGGRPLFGYRTRYWSFLLKLAKCEPSWTLPAQPGPSTGPFHWDSRPLAIPEMLRLQTLPADWEVEGAYRDQVRQVGNATPALLAEIIGSALVSQLLGTAFPATFQHAIARRSTVPRPKRTTPVPARFRAQEMEHPDHPGAGKGPRPRATIP